MKCQILFAGKNKKKYFSMSSAENFTQSSKHLLLEIMSKKAICTANSANPAQSAYLYTVCLGMSSFILWVTMVNA